MNQSAIANKPNVNSKQLEFCILLFVMFTGLTDWFDPRLITIYNFSTDSGTLLFPLTFLLGSILTEVYGFAYARRAIYYGLIFNLLFIGYGQLIIHLPGPDFYSVNHIFDRLFIFNIRIIIASITTYFVSELLNAYLTSSLQRLWRCRYLTVRFLIGTIIASGIDCFMFDTLAFYKVVSTQQLLQMILLAWCIMGVISTLGLPIAIIVTKRLKCARS